ncbi:MAG: hypothetical protein FD187_774 [bacterium]|nr:MAG: hypothetical protein FD142_649 [bacterium]KAF0149817.1 MAG: hypothetical protein FD187_774 [bacterium]KAF0168518.1 MAG: hypothetical protein FD158_1238 [bacterium]TXT19548.1 MAG: hypothetical protein FD132_1682 [bacterium]
MLRRLDAQGHILAHRQVPIARFEVSTNGLGVTLEVPSGYTLDLAIWHIPGGEDDLIQSLGLIGSLETQRYFLWSSHTAYACPADLYLHLVHGHVYENHEVWPRYWRVCSELDAYALYVVLTGLLRATGKRMYDLLRTQVVFSVIARQAKDGGWYHGEWTQDMESHHRLVNGAIVMLTAYLGEYEDPVVRTALEKGMAFLVRHTQKITAGTWFMHDSLEADVHSLAKYPFPYARSTALGKSVGNMLILNTHLDSLIALDLYAHTTSDTQYADVAASARKAACVVLNLRTAEFLYRLLCRILELTQLPKDEAMRLPATTRIIKRLGWKYLAPRMHLIKAIFPRLVMPNGFVDRSLCQKDHSTRYQSVHVLDLVRYQRRYPQDGFWPIVRRTLEYTQHSSIRAHWMEDKTRQDALGFWAEALYHLCLLDPEPQYRAWLAEAILDLEDYGLGLPPSLLGSNAEAIAPTLQCPCPSPVDRRLRVANLSRGDTIEWLIVNPTHQESPLRWETSLNVEMVWHRSDAALHSDAEDFPQIPQRGWIHGIGRGSPP